MSYGSLDTHVSTHMIILNFNFPLSYFSTAVFNDPRVECEAKTCLMKLFSTEESRPEGML